MAGKPLLIVQNDRLIMSLHYINGKVFKRIYDTILEEEIELTEVKPHLEELPKFPEV